MAHGPAITATSSPPKVASELEKRMIVSSSLMSRLTSLYGLVTRMTSCTPSISSKVPISTSVWLPVTPMAVRDAPGMACARKPSDSIFSHTRSTCSSEACAFMTISIRDPLFPCPIVYRGRRAAGNEKAGRTSSSVPRLESGLHATRFGEERKRHSQTDAGSKAAAQVDGEEDRHPHLNRRRSRECGGARSPAGLQHIPDLLFQPAAMEAL